MKKKNTIIDGIDVRECVYFGETMDVTHNCSMMGDEYLSSCERGTECYYKQLKIKEEECNQLESEKEELEEELAKFETLYDYFSFDGNKPKNLAALKLCINVTNEELIRMQRENKELKEEIASLEDSIYFMQENN